jgi:hypothetical protein
MQAVMDRGPAGGATLAIHTVATVEDFEFLRRIDIVSVKYGCCGDGDWRKAF